MSRAAVYEMISTDATLRTIGLADDATFITSGTDSPDVITQRPFVVIRWEDEIPFAPGLATRNCTVWVHDDGQDYQRIDAILDRVREILTNPNHVVGDDGRSLTQADWRGASSDLYDDGYRTITRNATYQVASRRF